MILRGHQHQKDYQQQSDQVGITSSPQSGCNPQQVAFRGGFFAARLPQPASADRGRQEQVKLDSLVQRSLNPSVAIKTCKALNVLLKDTRILEYTISEPRKDFRRRVPGISFLGLH